MEVRRQSYAETVPFPLLMDFTTWEKPNRVWQSFKTAMADLTVAFGTIAPPGERPERQLLGHDPVTGPSETTSLPSVLDVTGDHEDSLARLEIAAEMGDETAFVQAASEIDWSQRPAADFARAVHLALAAGAHLLARKLAAQGAKLHPDHPELQKMSHILAPPRVVKVDLPPVSSARANLTWLRAHADEYKGQWVALRDGSLLATAATADELKARLESTDGILLTRVF